VLLAQGKVDQIQNRLFTAEAIAMRAIIAPVIAHAARFAKLRIKGSPVRFGTISFGSSVDGYLGAASGSPRESAQSTV
jgi:hypothetical protein